MAFKQFDIKPVQRVTWFALDKDKFQAIFEDALNEMNLDSNDSRQNSVSGSTTPKEDLPKVKIEKTEDLHFQEEKSLEEIKCEAEEETKMESIDEIALPKDLSVSSKHSATFSDIRFIPHKDPRHPDLMKKTQGSKRSLTPELSRMQITHSLKRSHSATNLITNSSEILRDPIVPITNKIDDSEPIAADEPNVGLEKVLTESKKNFVSIENILSRDNEYFTKKSRPQFKSGESLNSSTLEYYSNISKSTSITDSLPTRCGWFGIDKKIFSGIVDTLSQIYFENFTRGELAGMNSPKFNLAADDSRSIHNQVTRAVEFHRQNSWYSNSSSCRKVSKANDFFSQNAHSRMFKERFPFSRSGLMSRCLLERGKTLKRSSKLASRISCGKGKECKRREKVLNSSCVSSTIGSPRKDGSSPLKRSCSPSNKSSGKESWIRVDKSLVNGMVDFLVGQLYPESEPSKKSEIKKEIESRNENLHNISDSVLNDVSRCSCKGENSTDSKTNSPTVKRVGGDRTNYSIGFLSKSESRGQKLFGAETTRMSNPSNDECNRSLDKKSQAWKSGTVQRIDVSGDKSPNKGYSSPAPYWNPGAANTLKEAILT